jgi:hypothetical protein
MGWTAQRTSGARRLPAALVFLSLVLTLVLHVALARAQPCSTDGECNGFGGGGCMLRSCENGFCGLLHPRNCNDGDPCTVDGCNEFGGFCTHEPFCLSDGLICDGSDECFVVDISGELVPICDDLPPSCDDADECTVDFCDDPAGCQHVPKDCADGNACTTDVCDHVLGCSNPAIEGCCRTAADCGDVCTGSSCVDDRCTAGAPPTCDDGNPCTSDVCSAGTGCANAPIAGCCRSDVDCGDPCSDGRACAGGTCVDASPDCDDGDACTTDACVAGTGCVATGRSGFDALACVCERSVPAACAAEPVPKKVGKSLRKACKLIGRASTAEAGKQQKLATRAGAQLGRARARVEKSDVADACRSPLLAQLSDGQRRAEVAAGGP